MYKKFFSFIITLALVWTSCVPTFAAESKKNDSANIDTFATLTSSSGTQYKVKVIKVGNPIKNSITNETSQTYSVSTDSGNVELIPRTVSSGSIISPMGIGTSDDWDNSISVHGLLTVNYSTIGTAILITNVNGSWTNYDSGVSLSNREVVIADFDYMHMSQYLYKYPTSNYFDYPTGFTTAILPGGLNAIAASNSMVTLKHGTSSSWVFKLNVTIFNSGVTP